MVDVQHFGVFFHAGFDFRLGHLAELEAESHVVKNGHVRVEGVVLENHRDVTVFGGYVVDQTVADVELAAGDFFQTGHHAKRGGFAAAGRADQYDKLFVFNVQVKVAHGGYITGVHFVNMVKGYACHKWILLM